PPFPTRRSSDLVPQARLIAMNSAVTPPNSRCSGRGTHKVPGRRRSTPMLMLLALPIVTNGMESALDIPKNFQGRWASSEGHCRLGGESVVVIEQSRVHFYESNGTILAIRRPTPLRIEVDLEFTGEGQTWHDTITLELSRDGRTLADPTRQSLPRPWSRTRCS